MAMFNTKYLQSLMDKVNNGDEIAESLRLIGNLAIPLYVEDQIHVYDVIKKLSYNDVFYDLCRPILKKIDSQKDENRLSQEKSARKLQRKLEKKLVKAKEAESTRNRQEALMKELQKKQEEMKKGIENSLKSRKRSSEEIENLKRPKIEEGTTRTRVLPVPKQRTALFKKCMKMRKGINCLN